MYLTQMNNNEMRISVQEKSSEYPMLCKFEMQMLIKILFDFLADIFYLIKVKNSCRVF